MNIPRKEFYCVPVRFFPIGKDKWGVKHVV